MQGVELTAAGDATAAGQTDTTASGEVGLEGGDAMDLGEPVSHEQLGPVGSEGTTGTRSGAPATHTALLLQAIRAFQFRLHSLSFLTALTKQGVQGMW